MFPRNHLRYARPSGSAKAMRSRRSCFSTSWMRSFRQLRWLKTSVNGCCRNLNEKNTPLGAKGPGWPTRLIPVFVSDTQVQGTAECNFCLLFVRTLEDLLPKERTEVKHARAASTNPQLQRQLTGSCLSARLLWSTYWRRFAIFCPRPTTASARLWLAGSARRCWMPSWATPPRRPSAPSSVCVEDKRRPCLVSGWLNAVWNYAHVSENIWWQLIIQKCLRLGAGMH